MTKEAIAAGKAAAKTQEKLQGLLIKNIVLIRGWRQANRESVIQVTLGDRQFVAVA